MSSFIHQSEGPKVDKLSFKESAKKEIVSMFTLFISISIFTLCVFYIILPEILDAQQKPVGQFLLVVSSIFVYILMCIGIILYSKKTNVKTEASNVKIQVEVNLLQQEEINEDLKSLELPLSIPEGVFKYSIKFDNMIKESVVVLIMILIIDIFSIMTITLYALETTTLSTGYELMFDKCIAYITAIFIFILQMLILFIFSSSSPTQEYQNGMFALIFPLKKPKATNKVQENLQAEMQFE